MFNIFKYLVKITNFESIYHDEYNNILHKYILLTYKSQNMTTKKCINRVQNQKLQ